MGEKIPELKVLQGAGVSGKVDDLLKSLKANAGATASDPGLMQRIRAVEVIERIGSPEAIRLLEDLASGDPKARLTRDAKLSLKRLQKQ